MSTYSAEAENALAFARQHDWGRHAQLATIASTGEAVLVDLIDLSDLGPFHGGVKTVRPASIAALREFGEY